VRREEEQLGIRFTTVVAAGLAGVVAVATTSFFGVAGTVIGGAVYMIVVTLGMSVFEAYLRRFGRWVSGIRGGGPVRKAPEPRMRVFGVSRRRSSLRRLGVGAAALSITLALVTGVEVGAGKNLSCLVWERCPSGEAEETPSATLPTVLGGGASQPDGIVPGAGGGEPVVAGNPYDSWAQSAYPAPEPEAYSGASEAQLPSPELVRQGSGPVAGSGGEQSPLPAPVATGEPAGPAGLQGMGTTTVQEQASSGVEDSVVIYGGETTVQQVP
jgi:hypothetical protein